jgi:2-keto-4-pentenoate hydratase/2-oxohepta-3-ene-1,7-dioic acid hydratase in catechol pathway
MQIARIVTAEGETCWAQRLGEGHFVELIGQWPDFSATGRLVSPARWLPPVEPPAIYGIGLNYADHARETGMQRTQHPVMFLKATTSLTGHQAPVYLPPCSQKVDYEVELAVVIGKRAVNVPVQRAMDVVFGYTVANDVTARDWQKHAGAGQWAKGKSFDSFCPLGPWVTTRDELGDATDLTLQCHVNEQRLQASTTANLLFPIPELIAYLSQSTTLLPGTVILTGTPAGVGMARKPMRFLQPGDVMRCQVQGLGELVNPVCEASNQAT